MELQSWEEKLLERARQILDHGHGKMQFGVSTHKKESRVSIEAGETYLYIIDRETGKEKK